MRFIEYPHNATKDERILKKKCIKKCIHNIASVIYVFL